ncbi:MAG: NADH-quinone oxidoreductase subunit J [Deltaproteobacteria bacterium]|nr:MAG: NADH-quinone oxidoreductase subunit J [Deltaproteobacteria bacterium]
MLEIIVSKYNYWIFVFLLIIGLYSMMTKNNLMKKLIGMNIFQWAIILYFISIGAKRGGSVPIIPGGHGHGVQKIVVHATGYVNPLPHVLMLTAIVVGVATTGIALAILVRIYNSYGTLEEDEIMKELGK